MLTRKTFLSPDDAKLPDEILANLLAECVADPLMHVLVSYPWGVEGTTLEGFYGPLDWQRGFLIEWGQDIRARGFNGHTAVDAMQYLFASGHGIGKSAEVAQICKFIMDTRPYAKGILTANTKEQLRTKTWAELYKWHSMSLTSHWFKMTSGEKLAMTHRDFTQVWRLDALAWREERSEAFAGQHNASSSSFYIFDEASTIPAKIFEVRLGGLTDGEPMTFDFGNPTQSSGMFYECAIGSMSSAYKVKQIDSRDVEITNKRLLNQIKDLYGEDSDVFKVRVKGQFPSQSAYQFIPTDWVEKCMTIEAINTSHDPIIMGVDVARYGNDDSVICIRRGRNARTADHRGDIPSWQIITNNDLMTLAQMVVEIAKQLDVDAICIDGTGVGAGVVDRCRQLGLDVYDIQGANASSKPERYSNLRAQSWGAMKEAIMSGVALPDDPDLKKELISLQFSYNLKQQIRLETKDEIRKDGRASPDRADALALTYSIPYIAKRKEMEQGVGNHTSDFDPFAPR